MIDDKTKQAEEDNERLEGMVRDRTSELSELASYLHQMREDERRSLARQLHDELGAVLTAAKLDITFIKSKCAESHPELVLKFDRIAAMLDQGATLKRRIIENLRPSTLELLGLAPAVRELVENFAASARTPAEAKIESDVVPRNDDALVVYRIIQEALSNVHRHAHATQVQVALERADDLLRVYVRDNGRGFDPLAAQKPAGHGLAVMRQRVGALGGKLSIVSAAGSGTEVEVWLPFHPE